MSKPLTVAVIGCGGIAQMMHLPTLAERPDLFTIGGIADVSDEVLRAVGERYHIQRRTKDFTELVAAPDIEAVIVLANGAHRKFVEPALAAGKHVFVEKPLGFSASDTQRIAAAAEHSGKLLMVGYHKRFDPAYQRARAEVQGLKALRYVDVTVLHPDEDPYQAHYAFQPPRQPGPKADDATIDATVRRDAGTKEMSALLEETLGPDAPPPARIALFILLTSLIHDINAVRGVLGEPEEVLSAHYWRDGMAQTSVTRFAGDVRVVMSWVSLPGVPLYEETLRFVSPEKRVKLIFPSPYLRHEPTPLVIERMEGDSLVAEHHRVSYEEAFRVELHRFRDYVLTGEPPSPGIEDAIGDMRWIEMIAKKFDGR
ncbi:MAG TPA: Gfo/Idh/MocA family oxidoreductase [Vicinamibacterales bacterium]|nr:Gfo/Idh/MocA family oxidoreductase [Vicinamibacterales bacterium]